MSLELVCVYVCSNLQYLQCIAANAVSFPGCSQSWVRDYSCRGLKKGWGWSPFLQTAFCINTGGLAAGDWHNDLVEAIHTCRHVGVSYEKHNCIKNIPRARFCAATAAVYM